MLERRDDVLSIHPLEPSQAFEHLCANNLDLVRSPVQGLAAFAWFAANVPMIRVRYKEAATAVPVLLELLQSRPSQPPLSWSVASTLDSPGRVTRRRPKQRTGVFTVRVGDETVLFMPATRHVIRLNRAAGELWATLDGRRVERSALRLCDELRILGAAR